MGGGTLRCEGCRCCSVWAGAAVRGADPPSVPTHTSVSLGAPECGPTSQRAGEAAGPGRRAGTAPAGQESTWSALTPAVPTPGPGSPQPQACGHEPLGSPRQGALPSPWTLSVFAGGRGTCLSLHSVLTHWRAAWACRAPTPLRLRLRVSRRGPNPTEEDRQGPPADRRERAVERPLWLLLPGHQHNGLARVQE